MGIDCYRYSQKIGIGDVAISVVFLGEEGSVHIAEGWMHYELSEQFPVTELFASLISVKFTEIGKR